MTRFKQEVAGDDGWSDWIHPLPGYKMACCDCGLVHILELRVDEEGQLNFRVRRDNRSTAQLRRHDRRKGAGLSKLMAAMTAENVHPETVVSEPSPITSME